MPSFGNRSATNLATCSKRIQLVLNKSIEIVDFSVICGYRNEQEQNLAFKEKRSTKQWPYSKHNQNPSPAVDLWPYFPGQDWKNEIWLTDVAVMEAVMEMDKLKAQKALETIKRWHHTIGIIIGVGHSMGIPLRSGGDWDKDFKFDDHRLIDLPHIEEM